MKKRGYSSNGYVPHDSHKKPEGRKNRPGALEKGTDSSVTIKTTTTTITTSSITTTEIFNFNPGGGYRRCSSADIHDLKKHGYHICTKIAIPYLHIRNQTVRGLCWINMQPCTYLLQYLVDPKRGCKPYDAIKKHPRYHKIPR